MEMELNKEALINQRDSRAWSQTQLAEVSGLSLRTIQRIEKTGIASQESAKSLAAVYECSITDLVSSNYANGYFHVTARGSDYGRISIIIVENELRNLSNKKKECN